MGSSLYQSFSFALEGLANNLFGAVLNSPLRLKSIQSNGNMQAGHAQEYGQD
jgi:hypothetical protein